MRSKLEEWFMTRKGSVEIQEEKSVAPRDTLTMGPSKVRVKYDTEGVC